MMAPTSCSTTARPELVLGSAGSNRIRSAILQVIVNAIDRGMDAQAAVDAPRLHFEDGLVYAEPGIDGGGARGRRAHARLVPRAQPVLRRRQAVERDPGPARFAAAAIRAAAARSRRLSEGSKGRGSRPITGVRDADGVADRSAQPRAAPGHGGAARRVRRQAFAVLALALIAAGPWIGFQFLVPLFAALVGFAIADRRVRRAAPRAVGRHRLGAGAADHRGLRRAHRRGRERPP